MIKNYNFKMIQHNIKHMNKQLILKYVLYLKIVFLSQRDKLLF